MPELAGARRGGGGGLEGGRPPPGALFADARWRQAEQVSIPGFRKGKVPAAVIDQRFGRGAALEEAINSSLPQFYGQAVEDIEVEVKDGTVAEEAVDERIDLIRKRFGSLKEVEREVQDGDFVTLDLTASIDGEVRPRAYSSR